MNYFAYGSNMSINRLSTRINIKKTIGIGMLTKHKLMFHKRSYDGSGKCDAYFTGKDSDVIYGVIYDIEDVELDNLDRFEGIGQGYKRKSIFVEGYHDSITYTAITYCAEEIDSTLKPYTWYKEHVLKGAEENGLPEEYINKIKRVKAIKDLDLGREIKELSIYS
jgi:gamma-glutamylcyclotransferase